MKVLNKSAGTCKFCGIEYGLLLQEGLVYTCIYCNQEQNLYVSWIDYAISLYSGSSLYKCVTREDSIKMQGYLIDNDFFLIRGLLEKYANNRRRGFCYCGALLHYYFNTCIYHGKLD